MTSHDYANKLKAAAEFLLSKPAFETTNSPILFAAFWTNKKAFLAAVKVLGTGAKEYDGDYLKFKVPVAEDLTFDIEVNRSAVCRLVKPAQEAVYDCEPLLSQEEEASLGAA